MTEAGDTEESRGGRARDTAGLCAMVVLLVSWAGGAKALLFRHLEYFESDLFSFLEMSWSWLFSGRLLYDNIYGAHGAIHNFYLLPLLSPFTVTLGAYGLILCLTIAYLAGGIRVARTPTLDTPGRVAVLAALLGPVALFVFDNPVWGFHPELFYPPLATLVCVDLLEGRDRRALLPAVLLMLVKEDGAVLLAAVLLVHFAWRLWRLRKASPADRRRVLKTSVLWLSAVTVVFVAGMALLALQSAQAGPMPGAEPRVARAIKIVWRTLAGEVSPFHYERLRVGLAGYALVAGGLLLSLGKRFPTGVALFLLSAPALVAVLTISSAHYRFQMMLWPPRLALLLGLLLACLLHAVSPASLNPSRRAVWTAGAWAAASWAVQIVLLSRVGYAPAERFNPARLLSGDGYRAALVPGEEASFYRCLAGRLPAGLPVAAPRRAHPFLHRQSLVFGQFEEVAWHPPRVRVVPVENLAEELPEGWCRGPRAGDLGVEGECGLVPLLEGCAPPRERS